MYTLHGKQRPYTPDFMVVDKIHGARFIEVKPAAKVCKPEFHEKFAAQKETAESLGIPLVLVTDRQIRINPILNNLKLLHRYSGIQSFSPLQIRLLEMVRESGAVKGPFAKLLA